MSSAVIGSPLTMTTTCWARAALGSAAAANTRTAAVIRLRQVLQLSNIIAPSASSPLKVGASLLARTGHDHILRSSRSAQTRPQLMGGTECRSIDRGDSLCSRVRRSAERAQADLHHVAVVDRHAAAVGVACDVIQGQDEAVVDVPDADLGLGDRLGVNIVSRRAQQDPVRIELEPCAAQDTLAAVQEPDQRLRGVVAVHHRGCPAAEGSDGFELAALKREVGLGEAEARGEG